MTALSVSIAFVKENAMHQFHWVHTEIRNQNAKMKYFDQK